MLKFVRNMELGGNTKFVLGLHRAKQLGLEYPLGSLGMGNIGIDSFTQGWTKLNKNPSWSWSFLAPIILPELKLELLGSNFCYQSWSWSFGLWIFS